MTKARPRNWTTRHRLTKRDRQVLSFLAEYGCVSAERIKAQFWSAKRNLRSHYRRFGVLKREGLIGNVMGDRSMSIGYRLTKKGKIMLETIGDGNDGASVRRGYKTQFEHDQLLIDLRRILQESPVVKEFRTEAEVRRDMLKGRAKTRNWEDLPSIPDATFVFEVPGQKMRVAIELELTAKAPRRYDKIFSDHLLSKNWDLVFYIVKNDRLLKHLRELLSQTKGKNAQVRVARAINGIYFCLLEEVLSNKLKVIFKNENEEISLAQIANNFGL